MRATDASDNVAASLLGDLCHTAVQYIDLTCATANQRKPPLLVGVPATIEFTDPARANAIVALADASYRHGAVRASADLLVFAQPIRLN